MADEVPPTVSEDDGDAGNLAVGRAEAVLEADAVLLLVLVEDGVTDPVGETFAGDSAIPRYTTDVAPEPAGVMTDRMRGDGHHVRGVPTVMPYTPPFAVTYRASPSAERDSPEYPNSLLVV